MLRIYVNGFLCQVFIQLRGTNGKLTKQHLVKKVDDEEEESMDSDQRKFIFKPGSTEHFILRSPDIGELMSVDIEVQQAYF